jgi:hypothetical protein
VALCWSAVICAALAPFDRRWLIPAGLALFTALWRNRRLYRFLAARRGGWFALRGAAVHVLYHVYNGVSFIIGAAGHFTTPRRSPARDVESRRGPASVTSSGAEVNSRHATPEDREAFRRGRRRQRFPVGRMAREHAEELLVVQGVRPRCRTRIDHDRRDAHASERLVDVVFRGVGQLQSEPLQFEVDRILLARNTRAEAFGHARPGSR